MITNKINCLFSSIVMLILLGITMQGSLSVSRAAEAGVKLAPLDMNGVAIGMSRREVMDLLGSPVRQSNLEGFIVLELTYPALVVGFDESDGVSELEARTSRACLLRKICRGAWSEDMQEELKAQGYLSNKVGDVLYISGDGCWGEVRLQGGRAQSVRVLCSP